MHCEQPRCEQKTVCCFFIIGKDHGEWKGEEKKRRVLLCNVHVPGMNCDANCVPDKRQKTSESTKNYEKYKVACSTVLKGNNYTLVKGFSAFETCKDLMLEIHKGQNMGFEDRKFNENYVIKLNVKESWYFYR